MSLTSIKKVINPKTTIITMWVVYLLLLFGLFSFLSSVAKGNDTFGLLPSFDELENPQSSVASEVYYEGGEIMGKYFRANRTPLEYKHISKNMIKTLIATEDVRFKRHSGVDLKGLIAIPYYLLKGDRRGSSTVTQQLAKNLFESRDKKYDGSWIENGGTRKKIIVKVKEWIIAVRLERAYTKNEIISMYLNTVDFGSHSYGVKVASQTFFNKDQNDLKIEEAAILVGVLKAPTYYSPIRNPENSLRRRNTVLGQLKRYKYLNHEEYDSIKTLPLGIAYQAEDHTTGKAQYFRTAVRNYLMSWCKQNGKDLWADGLRIYTTVDSTLQSYAEEAVYTHMSNQQKTFFNHWKGKKPWSIEKDNGSFEEMEGFLDKNMRRTPVYRYAKKAFNGNKKKIEAFLNEKKEMTVFGWDYKTHRPIDIDTTLSSYDSLAYVKHFLHTGFMSMNPNTGEIKAWVGGINNKHFQFDHVKQGIRQPGSTFKPIVYATILGEAGDVYSPCYKAVDAPVTFLTGDPTHPEWTPKNAEGEYSGDTMTIRQAMARSKNSITAYMMKILGEKTPEMVLQYARNLGISSHLEAVPAMCLGTFDVSVYDMVGAYSTFANKGVYTKPFFISRIEDKYGNVLMEFKKERRSVMSPDAAYTMLYMLRGATEEKGGTGRGLWNSTKYKGLFEKENQIGAKTGTTQNYSDGWFMGVTQDLVSGVWVGAEDRAVHFRNISLGQGARMAMPIWGRYMEQIYANEDLPVKRKKFTAPEGFVDYDCSTATDRAVIINAEGDTLNAQNEAQIIYGNDELDDLDD